MPGKNTTVAPPGSFGTPAELRTARGYAVADVGASTLALHGGQSPDPAHGSLTAPIVQSTTYAQEAVGVTKGYAYSRVSNPTVDALEHALGALEDAPQAVAFSTGLSATASLFLALVKSGDEVLVSDVVYGGTVRLLQQILAPLGVTARFIDTSSPDVVREAITERTRVLFIETPANPTLKLTDIEAVAAIARERGVVSVVDNTFLTAVLQRPLDLGADISLYSTTKFIEGHGSTVGGAVVSRDAALLERLRFLRKSLGTIQSPFEAWLTLRGVRTLALRLREHSRNALTVARFLDAHPAVTRVYYPGLPNHPQAALAARQHRPRGSTAAQHGGILAFEVRGGYEAALRLASSVRLLTLAENCGSVETLLTHSASMTHADVPREQRLAAGISDGLIRISVGLEDAIDIIADLDRALDLAVQEDSPQRTQSARSGERGEHTSEEARGESFADVTDAATHAFNGAEVARV